MERRCISIRGVVQGVGFRPFVHALASRMKLCGFVKNHTGGVRVEVEGQTSALDGFESRLLAEHPILARIDEVVCDRQAVRGDRGFHIEQSDSSHDPAAAVSPDAGICADCLSELWDATNRRYRYPFINCVNCGPRLTIVTEVPFDRMRTTMASFTMCAACHAEYRDPRSRRFHAQATACPACGPQIWLVDANGTKLGGDSIGFFGAALLDGKIGATKGLGGYHLICGARSAAAVAELRRRKAREEKPFAIMVRDLAAARELCHIGPVETELLESWRRPIVLLRKRSPAAVAEEVAPGNSHLGVMLPYTPLHHLLMEAVGGAPLVMTSGNRSEEPIAYRTDEAQDRLKEIADFFIHDNRPIHVRCDDSVARVIGSDASLVRRSRGYAPQPIALPIACSEPLLAVGGQLKVTFALGRAHEVILSHHLGDLDDYEAYRQFEKDVEHYQKLFEVRPKWIIHDLHPDYGSTGYALRRQAQDGTKTLAVQHHHAHLASCLADNGVAQAAIGLIFDGAGYGTDGAIWGGEFLVGDFSSFRRAGHLRYVGLPGGPRAIREPWRMAASYLLDAGLDVGLLTRCASPESLRIIEQMLERRLNTPLTSSAGRLFDAVASLAGVRDRVTFEGQAAMELEGLAGASATDRGYPFEITEDSVGEIVVDTRPLIREVVRDVVRGVDSATIARRFHSTLVDLISAVCHHLRRQTNLKTVALSGGVFLNALLTTEVTGRLTDEGFRVLRHRCVPPNDGGLSLGQLAVGAARLAAETPAGAADVSGNSR